MAADGEGGETQQLQLRLMVDKRKMRLVYAECDRFMADVLLSFLTTPVGALVRRTGKSSGLGSMDSLYQSVEDMAPCHFETPECRDLLLRPMSAFGFAYNRLKIRINDAEEFSYGCPNMMCGRCSLFPGAKCECGQDLTFPLYLLGTPPRGSDEAFIRKDVVADFVVTDDLFIAPSSDALKRKLCTLAGVVDDGGLEEKIVLVDNDQTVQLMKLSLLSNTPLTDTFLPSNFVTKPIHWPLEFLQQHLIETRSSYLRIMNKLGKDLLRMLTPTLGTRKMSITLFHIKDRVVFAIVEKDIIDVLFSFLTLPFGSIAAAFDGNSSLRCIDNLHQVVKRFRSDLFFKRRSPVKQFENYLLKPAIALHHTTQNDLLKIGRQPFSIYLRECRFCDINGLSTLCTAKGHTHVKLKTINPKYNGKQTTKKGGGYLRRPETFVITNGLVVKPIYDLSEKYLSMDLVERTVLVGRKEALKLLMASLVSEDPLTSVFIQADGKYYGDEYYGDVNYYRKKLV